MLPTHLRIARYAAWLRRQRWFRQAGKYRLELVKTGLLDLAVGAGGAPGLALVPFIEPGELLGGNSEDRLVMRGQIDQIFTLFPACGGIPDELGERFHLERGKRQIAMVTGERVFGRGCGREE